MTSRVVVETPRPEPCMYAGCVIPHMDRRVLEAGEYVLIERDENGEWPMTAVHSMTSAWILSEHSALGDQIIDGLDALAGGSP